MKITRDILNKTKIIGFLNEEESAKALLFLEKLKNKINLNPTIEKLAFYRLLENRIINGDVEFDMNGKGRFLISFFGYAEQDHKNENWNYSYPKDDMGILKNLIVFVPEFFETINSSFELGDDLDLPKVPNELSIKDNEDVFVKRFWEKLDPVVQSESQKINENGNENALFLLVMKYLKASNDDLPLNLDDGSYFYSAYRKYDIIQENLSPYIAKIKGANLKLNASYDMIVWDLFCSAFPEKALSKKEIKLFEELSEIINNNSY